MRRWAAGCQDHAVKQPRAAFLKALNATVSELLLTLMSYIMRMLDDD